MKSKKRKILWLDVWDLEEQEAWFSDMASHGWMLVRLGNSVATFERSEPKKINYRCDIFKLNDRDEKNRIEIYKQNGWEYVASRLSVHVFREMDGEGAIEIHTDPIEQAETLSILKRSINRRGISTIILLLFAIPLLIGQLKIDPVGNYLDNGFLDTILYTLLYSFFCYTMVNGMIHLAKLKKKLESGNLFNHNISYKKKIVRNKLIGSCMMISVFAWFISVFVNILLCSDDRVPLTSDIELPVVQFADFMDENYTTVSEEGDQGLHSNFYAINSSFLVPKQYELRENVEVPDVMWEDGSGTYTPTLWSYGYQLRGEWIAQRFIQTLMKNNDPYERYIPVTDTSFNELWVAEEEFKSSFLARNGKNVYRVVYFGMDPIEEIIEETKNKVVKD